MSILVTGSTGTVGSEVVSRLASEGAAVRALTRSPEQAGFPAGVMPVKGDMLDMDAMRNALQGVRTLFLINAVAPDEVTQALLTVSLAREAGVERFVYLSVIHADQYTNVPHFTGKYTVERMFREQNLAVTILRPGYYMQNDLGLKEIIADRGVYPQPVGQGPFHMTDVRDLAEVAARRLLVRDQSEQPLPRETIDVVAPQILSGPEIADIWSKALNRSVRYGSDDLDAMERQMAQSAPGWIARDMRLMMQRYQRDGVTPAAGTDAHLEGILGRPMHSYADFVREHARH
jgi:uncharacterized protein YbjT (DUF2867 family)